MGEIRSGILERVRVALATLLVTYVTTGNLRNYLLHLIYLRLRKASSPTIQAAKSSESVTIW
jgi:hypothetical protein